MKADNPNETNTITEPDKIVPVEIRVNDLKKTFSRVLPPYSINIMELHTNK